MKRPTRKTGHQPRFEVLEERCMPSVDVASYDGFHYKYAISNVPDFDQIRSADSANGILGLPNNGAMYCVPTSAMNWLAYIANHGYPKVPPGPSDQWQLSGPPFHTDIYNTATSMDALLGLLMGTDPVTGTKDGPQTKALNALLNGTYPSQFLACNFADTNVADMAHFAVDGALVLCDVGWYTTVRQKLDSGVKHGSITQQYEDQQIQILQSAGFDVDAYFRDGGHQFTLVGADGTDNGFATITIHDPAHTNDSTTLQSLFHDATFSVEPETLNMLSGGTELFSHMLNYGSARLDGFEVILPFFGLTADANKITLVRSIAPFVGGQSQTQDFQSATGGKVLDIAINPQGAKDAYIIQGDNHLWQIDTLTGKSTIFADVTSPQRVVYPDNNSDIFVLGSRDLYRLGQDGSVQRHVSLKQPLDAIAWDGTRGELVGYAAKGRLLEYFDRDLRVVSRITLPAVAGDHAGGRFSISVSPQDGTLWIHRDGSPQVRHIRVDVRGRAHSSMVSLTAVAQPMGISVDDHNVLYFCDGSVLKAFDSAGRPVTTPLTGMRGGSTVQVLRSFHGGDPATARTLADRNVLPEDVDMPHAVVAQTGDALFVLGDADANHIDIIDQGNAGVHLTVDGLDGWYTQNVRRIIVEGNAGNDVIRYQYVGDPGSKPRDLYLHGGDGADQIIVEASHDLLRQKQPWPWIVQEDGGAGADTITWIGGAALPSASTAPGGIPVFNTYTGTTRIQSPVQLWLDGGTDNDIVNIGMNRVTIDALFTILATGGPHDDTVNLQGTGNTLTKKSSFIGLLYGGGGQDHIHKNLALGAANLSHAFIFTLPDADAIGAGGT